MEGFQSDSSQPCVCIGSKLRLLSQLKVRYEGTLHSVDTQKSTISLKNVRTFGTEGRSPGNEVPGSDETFEIIVFRAGDISEIFMIEAPPTPVSMDPAIVDFQQTREKQNALNSHSQREYAGNNLASGPESVQSGDHHVPRHDISHSKPANKAWGSDNHRGNDREQSAWGQSQRAAQIDRRQGPGDSRRDREGFGERNGPYSAGERKMPVNNGNARSYQNQQPAGRSAAYGYGNDRQGSGRQGGFYGGQQSSYHDQDHRQGYRQGENVGRSGWRDQRSGREGAVPTQRNYHNQRDGEDKHQVQRRNQQYGTRDGPQQPQRGRNQPQQRKEQGGQRSRDRENQRDSQSKDAKNVPEFDFEKAAEEFSKLDLNQASVDKDADNGNASETENKDGGTDSAEPTYQKDSFFDEISRDSRQAQRPKTSERSLNMQTFGAAATRRRPASGRYYNRRPGNWAGSGGANGETNGPAQVSA